MSKIYAHGKKIVFVLFLIAYALLLAKALLFKQVSPLELFNADRMARSGLNLTPFRTIAGYSHFNYWIAFMNIVGNVALFVPMGLYLQIFLKNKKILRSVALVCAVSVCVEAVQYLLGLGSADIDDVILNTLGGLLGVLIYRLLYAWLKDREKAKTAVTFLFCIVCACYGVGSLVLSASGLNFRIF